jgi:RimJ/RimL family protein N-acetyltransferase
MPDLFLNPSRAPSDPHRSLLVLSRDEFAGRAHQLLGACPVAFDDAHDAPVGAVGSARLLLFRLVAGENPAPDRRALDGIESVDQAYHLYATNAAAASYDEPSVRTAGRATEAGRLSGTFVALRPLALADLDWLRVVLSHPEVLPRPPARGVPPSPEMLVGLLDQPVLCQFVVTDADRMPVGLVRATDADLHNRHAHLEFVFPPSAISAGWPLEGAGRFVDYCFETFGLRKLYAEIDDDLFRRLPDAAKDLLRIEGILRDHREHLGEWVDVTRTCIWRDDWMAQRARWLAPPR